MMEKLSAQYDEWTQSHRESWIGRNLPGPGWFSGGVSAQLDLMSPTSLYDFAQKPTQLNLLKAAYGPGIALGGYAWVSVATGAKIEFGHKVVHSAHMTLETAKYLSGHAARAGMMSFRAVRAISPYAVLAAVGYGLVRGAHELLDGPILGGFHIDLR